MLPLPVRRSRSAALRRLGPGAPAGLVLVAGALLAGACIRVDPGCTPAPAPALNVTIVDAATGAYLAAGATVLAVDGSFRETLGPGDYAPSGELATRDGVFGRAGSYTVTVSHPGYADWSRRVDVRSDRCGVVTAPVRAELERDP